MFVYICYLFFLAATSGIVRPSGHLDYELMLQKYYVLNISASDSGHPVYSSTAQLNVSVTDYNDNKPVFSESVYTVGVPEDSQRGSVVLQVVASDADSGENAKARILQFCSFQNPCKTAANIPINAPTYLNGIFRRCLLAIGAAVIRDPILQNTFWKLFSKPYF